MAAEERDSTGEWLLPVGGGPPTLYDLEQRVEVAISIARAAETAALEIGAASVEAAQQARRAAELAETASRAAVASGAMPLAGGNRHPPAVEEVAVEPEPIAFEPEPEPEPAAPEPAPELAAIDPPSPGPQTFAPPLARQPEPDPFQERLLAFRERAERVSVRFRRLDDAAPISSS